MLPTFNGLSVSGLRVKGLGFIRCAVKVFVFFLR